MLLEKKGELLNFVPKQVKMMKTPREYQCLALPIKDVLFKKHSAVLTAVRLIGRIWGRHANDPTYTIKQIVHRLAQPFLPDIPGEYDMAISFIDPHYIVANKVRAKVKIGWLHTDFSRIQAKTTRDYAMWDSLDHIAHISDSCKGKFDALYPDLAEKSIVVENILSKAFIQKRSKEMDADSVFDKDAISLLSIGRFCTAKNFDNVPDICRRLLENGLNVKWYLIGFGGDEALIRQKIAETAMQDHVIVLGKKENPYPYLSACDLYVQPSRYEGKSVTVREAQMLGKPVVITRYATSASQLEDGMDGIIVPMDNQGCADGIIRLLRNPQRMKQLSDTCKLRDYSNKDEVKKLYGLMEK